MPETDRDGAADVIDTDGLQHPRVAVRHGQYAVVGESARDPGGGRLGGSRLITVLAGTPCTAKLSTGMAASGAPSTMTNGKDRSELRRYPNTRPR